MRKKILRVIESLRQDFGYGVRGLVRKPGFTAVVVLTLALGIGANTAIFSVVHDVLMRTLPYRAPDRLVILHQAAPRIGEDSFGFSVPDFTDFRERARTFSALSEYHSMWFILLGRPEPERVQTAVVSDNFFDLLGVKPLLGRTFLPGGTVAALFLVRLMKGVLYGVSPTDPLTFIAVALALLVVAVIACVVPARRATLVNPIIALRAN